MKICWDNLEKIRYSKKTGKWYNGAGGGYVEKESCKNCNEPFLSRENNSDFCCRKCSSKGVNNGMYGKTHTEDIKKLLSKNIQKSFKTIKKKYNVDNISQLDSIKNKKGQFIINEFNVQKLIKKRKHILIDIDGNNKNALLTLKCINNHIFTIKYHSFKTGHGCSECYYQFLRDKGIQNIEGFELYKYLVESYTKKSYRKYKNIINPKGLRRGRNTYHLDHRYSKIEGYKNNILPSIIGSYHNLELLNYKDNCSKQGKCSITKEELFDGYFGKIK